MTSTNFTSGTALTTTTNDDDNANLLKPKKKKGLFKNLFHFGSKKGRSKSASAEPSDRYSHHHRHHDDSHTSDEAFRSPDLNRNRQYQAEQEKINAHYRKLMEQARHQQQQQSQPPQFVRNQLHPLHKSMPAGQRSKSSPNAKMDANLVGSPPMNGNGAFHPGFHASPQHYGRTLVNRDTVGVPHKGEHSSKINAYLRQQHRVHPEMKMTEGSPYGDSSTQVRLPLLVPLIALKLIIVI